MDMLILAVLAVAAATIGGPVRVVLRRSMSSPAPLGWMSERWLAEHRAMHP